VVAPASPEAGLSCEQIQGLSWLTALTRLKLAAQPGEAGDAALRSLSALGRLQELWVAPLAYDVSTEGLAALAALPSIATLSLGMANEQVRAGPGAAAQRAAAAGAARRAGAQALAHAPAPALPPPPPQVPHLEVLQPVPQLRLQLHDEESAAAPSLLSIGGWLLQHNLVALQLGVVQVANNDLFLSLGTLTNLTSLSLSLQEAPGCQRAFLNIASLSSLGRLQELSLTSTTRVRGTPAYGDPARAAPCAAAAPAPAQRLLHSARSRSLGQARPGQARPGQAAAARARARAHTPAHPPPLPPPPRTGADALHS
jgi:hypothetical protein